jgi:hypothetical protein
MPEKFIFLPGMLAIFLMPVKQENRRGYLPPVSWCGLVVLSMGRGKPFGG